MSLKQAVTVFDNALATRLKRRDTSFKHPKWSELLVGHVFKETFNG